MEIILICVGILVAIPIILWLTVLILYVILKYLRFLNKIKKEKLMRAIGKPCSDYHSEYVIAYEKVVK